MKKLQRHFKKRSKFPVLHVIQFNLRCSATFSYKTVLQNSVQHVILLSSVNEIQTTLGIYMCFMNTSMQLLLTALKGTGSSLGRHGPDKSKPSSLL